MYRTGDLAVICQGKVVVRGRADDTVKINAVRVHLNEINRALMDAHREFTQVYTLALQPPGNNKIKRRHPGTVLVVLYTSENKLNLDNRSLIREIKSQVMVPNAPFLFSQVASIPTQLHSGKVNRVALRTLAQELLHKSYLFEPSQQDDPRLKRISAHYYGGQLSKESVTYKVFECIFECTNNTLELEVGPMDQLADIGLDSLAAVLLVEALKEKGIEISHEDLVSVTSVQELVLLYEKRKSEPKFMPSASAKVL